MIRTMMAAATGHTAAARAAQHRQALLMRKAIGFAILTSGLVVIAAQALHHTLGG
jgi:hypothetical protein